MLQSRRCSSRLREKRSRLPNLRFAADLMMEKYQHMRSFISAVADYTKHPSEAATSILQRNLGVIGVSIDLSVFDPGSSIAAEFYVSLHELMNSLASRSPLIWCALDVLQNACKNSAARRVLIHTYKFAPILTRLLETNLTPEKRVRVLKLLQELTYGVKLSWQEAHLPYLISPLTQWVSQSKDEEVVSLSLGILINLCYKNLPAVYTLMRTIDVKTFTRNLLNIRSMTVNTRVQCCKLMIIMESINGSIPAASITEFVTMTFDSVIEALKNRDVLLLRHTVDFFDDVRQAEYSKTVLMNYQNYADHVERILSSIVAESDPECVSLVMEFLLSVVSLKHSSLVPLYAKCVKVAMSWVTYEIVCSKALALIKTIVVNARRMKISTEIMAELDLSTLMLVANGREDDEMNGLNEKQSSESQTMLTELVQLLQEMVRIPMFKSKVMQAFGEQAMRQLLKPMLEQNDLMAAGDWPRNLFDDPATSLYVHALALAADLATDESSWLALYSELLQKKTVHMIMALALYTGDSEVKQKVLQLTSSVGFIQECLPSVSRCMCELEPLVLIQNATGTVPTIAGKYPSPSQNDMAPLFSFNQESRLDTFLAKLEEAYNNNRIADTTTSAVMELYDYKLAAMRHAERATQASLEAANNHATSLQHRLAQVVAESSRLHQLLFHNQQCLEGVRAEKANLSATLQAKTERIELEIPKLKKIVADKSATIESDKLKIASLMKELEASMNKAETLSRKSKELKSELSIVEAKVKDQGSEMSELKKQLAKLQDNVNKKEQVIEKRDRAIAANLESISALKQEIVQLTSQCHTYEQTLAEKEECLEKMENELKEFSRMRDMIFQITASKKKGDQNETT